MKSKITLIFFLLMIYGSLIGLSIYFYTINRNIFFLLEITILISLVLGWRIYKNSLMPFKVIQTGIEFIKDKDFHSKLGRIGHKGVDQLIDVYNTMIDHLRKERLRQQEQNFFLDKVIEVSPAGIIILDLDDKITAMNPAAEKILNLSSEQANKSSLDIIPGKLGEEIRSMGKTAVKLVALDGINQFRCQRAHFYDRGFMRHLIFIEELTQEIMQAEKRGYEKIIRMMSHEINNSVGAVNSILDSTISYFGQYTSGDHKEIEQALNVALRRNQSLNDFIKKFADVVRIPLPVKELSNLHDLLQRTVIIMESQIDNNKIEIALQPDKKPFIVAMDSAQIEQVLVNILKNAIEALNDTPGKITIITDTKEKKCIISDNGPGIPEHIQPVLFTPFFSTKQSGQGIGLTLTREILQNHGFTFSLKTVQNNTTEFIIYFQQ
jgi:two-component system nitrogen regulation sensor histidine kinase NtrY